MVDYTIHVHNPDNTIFVNSHQFLSNSSSISSRKQPDYLQLKPFFLYASPDTMKTYISPFPALNIHRRNEAVVTGTVFSDTPAVDNGSDLCWEG